MNQLALVEDRIVLPTAQFTPTGWHPDHDLSYEEWEAVGRGLSRIGAAVNWWIGDWINYGQPKYGEKYAQALEVFDGIYEYQSLRRMSYVSANVRLLHRCNNLTWTHHLQVAALDEDAQVALLNKAAQFNLSVSQLRGAIREYKRNVWIEERDADLHATDIHELPTGVYRILYIDPPWQYQEHGATVDASYGGVRWHYPSMSVEELCDLPVGRLAAPDCVLFLWATSPKLQDAFTLLDAWGFEYKTSFVWDKVAHNFGYYNSVRHELLLVAGRGSSTPDTPTLYDSVVSIEREEHSAKPEEFRRMIDELYVDGRRIELFARSQSEGWDSWGNEAI